MNTDPASGSPEWQQIKAQFPVGARVRGTVISRSLYGIVVHLGGVSGIVRIAEFLDEGRMTAEQYPPVGSEIEAVVLGFQEEPVRLIVLSMRPSRLRDAK